jgi:hypothetical protein
LERQVVDREKRLAVAGKHRRKRRRPVVAMDHVVLGREARGDPREQPEAQRIVRPVLPARILVGIAVALIELRRAQQQNGLRVQERALEAELAEARTLLCLSHFPQHFRVGGQKNIHVDAELAQRRGQCRAHVAQAARFRERRIFRSNEQNPHAFLLPQEKGVRTLFFEKGSDTRGSWGAHVASESQRPGTFSRKRVLTPFS